MVVGYKLYDSIVTRSLSSVPVDDEARLGRRDVLAVRSHNGVGDDGTERRIGQLEVELAGEQVPNPDAVARYRHGHSAPKMK